LEKKIAISTGAIAGLKVGSFVGFGLECIQQRTGIERGKALIISMATGAAFGAIAHLFSYTTATIIGINGIAAYADSRTQQVDPLSVGVSIFKQLALCHICSYLWT